MVIPDPINSDGGFEEPDFSEEDIVLLGKIWDQIGLEEQNASGDCSDWNALNDQSPTLTKDDAPKLSNTDATTDNPLPPGISGGEPEKRN